ncbi:MAG: hypothetical protein ACFFB5_18180 [Promethearchaeota archaeon]
MNIRNSLVINCIIFTLGLSLISPLHPVELSNSFLISKFLTEDQNVNVHIQEDEPVSGIVQIGSNISKGDFIFILGFHSRIIAFNYNKNEIIWNKSFGLEKNEEVFIWKLIPNSLRKQEVSGVYVSLSNGTIFEISMIGQVLWTKSLGSLAISSLVLVEAPYNPDIPFYIVTGGDNKVISWLTPEGVEDANHTTSSEITIIVTKESYSLVGTRSGEIYVFNGTDDLWNESIGDNQVLAIDLYLNLVIAYSYENGVIFLDLQTSSIDYSGYYGLLTYKSIQIIDRDNDTVFLSKNNGELVAVRVSDKAILWNNTDIPGYITNMLSIEFTGDLKNDLVVCTASGHVFVLNQTTGNTVHYKQVAQEQLSFVLATNLNNDTIVDLIIGTLNGKIISILGSDLTPPIISELYPIKLSYNSYNISIVANEPVRANIKYGLESLGENSKINQKYLSIHIFILENLQAESNYSAQVLINDKNNNTASSEVFKLITSSAPAPFPVVELLLGSSLVFGLIAAAYLYNRRVIRHQALLRGEEALKNSDYTNAIKHFYKAKSRDRLVEVAKILILNPELFIEMNEIRRMKELKEYITVAQEIVEQSQDT